MDILVLVLCFLFGFFAVHSICESLGKRFVLFGSITLILITWLILSYVYHAPEIVNVGEPLDIETKTLKDGTKVQYIWSEDKTIVNLTEIKNVFYPEGTKIQVSYKRGTWSLGIRHVCPNLYDYTPVYKTEMEGVK